MNKANLNLLNRNLLVVLFFLVSFAPNTWLNTLWADNVVIPIEGEIEPSLVKYLKRTLADAEAMNPTNIIFEINTFGGRVDTTYEIVDLILEIDTPTIAVVKQKAISAGTLIALASRNLYMFNNSTIGDVAPIIVGQNGPQVLGEKFQSPLRAKFRALAQRNGYPEKLVEAFVTDSIEIIEVTWDDGKKEILTGTEYNDLLADQLKKITAKKTLIEKGELLTMSDKEALELGFSKKSIADLEEVTQNDLPLVRLEKKNSEIALSYMIRYGWLLLLIGLGGIYLEVRNPGFGFYGIMALVAFALFFLGNYLVELANYWELVLLIIGLLLLFIEVFVIPGFGIIGVAGFAVLFISTILMMQRFTIPTDFIELSTLEENLGQVVYVFIGSGILFFLAFISLPSILRKSPIVFQKKLGREDSKLKDSYGFSPKLFKKKVPLTPLTKDDSGGDDNESAKANEPTAQQPEDQASKEKAKSKAEGIAEEDATSRWPDKENATFRGRDEENATFKWRDEEDATFRWLLGKEGKTISKLRPSGTVEIEEEIYDAMSDGDFVDVGKAIKVIEVKGNVIYVSEIV